MVNYRRLKIPGATYFFTVTLRDRKSNLLIEHIDLLKISIKKVQQNLFYTTKAIVVLPDHIHTIWELPPRDDNFSLRWMKIKSYFTRSLIKRRISLDKNSRNEYNLFRT